MLKNRFYLCLILLTGLPPAVAIIAMARGTAGLRTENPNQFGHTEKYLYESASSRKDRPLTAEVIEDRNDIKISIKYTRLKTFFRTSASVNKADLTLLNSRDSKIIGFSAEITKTENSAAGLLIKSGIGKNTTENLLNTAKNPVYHFRLLPWLFSRTKLSSLPASLCVFDPDSKRLSNCKIKLENKTESEFVILLTGENLSVRVWYKAQPKPSEYIVEAIEYIYPDGKNVKLIHIGT